MSDFDAKVARQLRRWRENPVAFVRECLKAEPDDWQMDILNAFPTHNRIAMQACKGPGKSAIMAMCVWNFLLTRPDPKIVATSITGDNLRDGLWAELAKWQYRSEILRQHFTWNKERIFYNDRPETWFASARSWPKDADPQRQADTLAGIHADYVLFVIDEAGGIPEGVAAAAEAGLSTGIETKLMIAGNPTHREGPLFNAATRDRKMWFVKEITGDPDDPKRAKRIDPQWAKDQIEKYGRDNPFVLVNVFGKFPPSSENTLISPIDVEEAQRRLVPADQYNLSAKIIGVDVARFGSDRTVVTLRQGLVAFEQDVHRNLSNMEVAGLTAHYIEKHQPDAVFIDQTGLGGGVVDRLLELGHNVIGIDSAQRPTDPKYLNMRAQMWGRMAEWVKGGGSLPKDNELGRELYQMPYSFASNGKLKIKSKDELKKDGLPSPDLADSLALTFALPVVARNIVHRSDRLTRRVITEYDPFEV